MAFKRSAVRSRLSPPKVLKTIGFQHFFLFLRTFEGIFRPLEFRSNLMHSRGVVMARISMRNVQKSSVSEYFDLYLSSAAARGVKDKTLQTYKNHFRSIAKRMDVTVPMNRLNSQDLENMISSRFFSVLSEADTTGTGLFCFLFFFFAIGYTPVSSKNGQTSQRPPNINIISYWTFTCPYSLSPTFC